MKKNAFRLMKSILVVAFLMVLAVTARTADIRAEDVLQLTFNASTWPDGYNVNMTVKNTSNSTVDGWTLILSRSDFTITNLWCAKSTISGNDIIITPESWNKTVSPGGYVTFGFTGQGTFNRNFSYTLSSSGVTPPSSPTTPAVPTQTPTPTPAPGKGTFRVFLLLGQSNMAGYPKAQDSDRVEDPRILVLGYSNNPALGRVENEWDIASPPLHEVWQDAIGPGDWFAKTLINYLPEGDTIGLVPCAISGERIETFMKGGSKYDWIIQRARIAQQSGGVIQGILFHQGESNNGDPTWPQKVKTLVEDLRRDLNIGDVPFIAGELLYSGSCAGHNVYVNQLPSIISNCYVVSAEGLVVDPSDMMWGLHFSHDSQVTLGKRYAEIMRKALGL